VTTFFLNNIGWLESELFRIINEFSIDFNLIMPSIFLHGYSSMNCACFNDFGFIFDFLSFYLISI
jgi:hypothetical protein